MLSESQILVHCVYDYSTGQILTSTDPNGQTTTNEYDALGRLTKIWGPLDTDGYASVMYEYDLTTAPNRITKKVKTDYGSGSYITTYTFTNGFGRVIQTKSPAESGRQVISGAAIYDYRGKVKEQYQSYFENSASSSYSTPNYSVPYTSYDYDYLGRVTAITTQNEAGNYIQATNSYYGWCVTSTDFKGNVKDSYYDAYGRLVKVTENYTYNTTYTYGSLGNLTRVTDNAGNITSISYDSLGRKLSMTDPDMGYWSYAYDDNGNLVSQTDSKGQTITFTYDALNRLIQKITPDGTVTYYYDQGLNGTGRLNRVDYNDGSTQFFYDELGREIKIIKTINSTSYIIERTYDALDRLKTLKYPDDEILSYVYDASGAVKNIQGLTKNYIQDIAYNAQGQMTSLIYGNSVTTTYNYNEYTNRLTSLVGAASGGEIQNLSYTFDNVGNVTSITDTINTATQSFQYDNLNRLTYADSPAGYGSINYAYNSIGNLTQKGTRYFNYGEGTAGPHALTSSTDGQIICTYDSNGNMLTKNDTPYTYDAENRLKKAVKPADVVHDTFEISLSAGWNFFSIPCIPDVGYNIADVLSSISGYYTQVTRYNTSTGKYESYAGDPEYDQFGTMEYLRGYQIYCEAPCTLTITGSSPTSTKTLSVPVGDNLVGVDITNNGKSAAACFFSIAYSSIKWYNPDTQQREDVSSGDTVYMGRAYWIDCTSTSTYSVTALKDVTTFTYDGDGGRVKKTVNGSTTTYIGSLFEKKGCTTTRHIFLGDTRIASVDSTGGIYFYHADHLGSTSDVTDKDGDHLQHTEYQPYGETYEPSSWGNETDYLYTGKLLDKSTQLYFYGARYYDPELGRFITADTIVPDPSNPQAFNRYGYANNNPIRYTDPTGHSFWDRINKWFDKFDKWCYDHNIDFSFDFGKTYEFGPGGEGGGPGGDGGSGGQDDFVVGDPYIYDYNFTYPFERDLIYPPTVPADDFEHTPIPIGIPSAISPVTRIAPTGGAGKPTISDITEYDPVGAALQIADYQELEDVGRPLTWLGEMHRYLVEVGGVMEKDHSFLLNTQSIFGFTGVVSGAASNVGLIPRQIGVSNKNFLKGGRLFYRWANQYGRGIKAMSFAKMGAVSGFLSVFSVAATAYTAGSTIDSYIHGYREYRRKR